MSKKIITKQQDDLGKGINTFTRDTMIKENECPVGFNVWAVGKNSIAKRPGIVKLCTIAGGNPIDGLGAYYSGATRNLVAVSNGVPYTVETGTAITMSAVPASAGAFTAGKRHDFCQAAGKIYTANGVDTIRTYDGTWREPAGSIVAKYLIYYKSSLWAAGNPTYPTRLYRSGTDINIGNFTYTNSAAGTTTSTTANKLVDSGATFSSANVTVGCQVFNGTTGKDAHVSAIDSGTALSLDADIFSKSQSYFVANNSLATSVYVSKDDGQKITGFFKHMDNFHPVKERSLWQADQGTDQFGLIQLSMVDPSRGCDSHYTIDAVDNDNFMFNENGVFATGYEPNMLVQLRTNIVSLRVDDKIKSIEKSKLEDTCGIYFDNHYYLSYAEGGATYNNKTLIYDRQRLGWWEFDIGAQCFSEFKDSDGYTKLYFGDSSGNIYYFDAAVKNDDSTAISTQWKTPKLGFGNYAQSKFFLNVVLYLGRTPGNITINVYVDGTLAKTTSKTIGNSGFAGMGIGSIGTYTLGVEGGSMTISDTGGGDYKKIDINKIGRNIQIEIIDNSSSKGWELNSYQVTYSELDNLYQPGI